MAENTAAELNGASGKVIDLSVMGAQVLSPTAVRPQQRVKVTLADAAGVVWVNASVAGSSFEIPKGGTRYRAGIEFSDAEAKALEAFCKRHQKTALTDAHADPLCGR